MNRKRPQSGPLARQLARRPTPGHSFTKPPEHYRPGDPRTIALHPSISGPPTTEHRPDAPLLITAALAQRPGLAHPGHAKEHA